MHINNVRRKTNVEDCESEASVSRTPVNVAARKF